MLGQSARAISVRGRLDQLMTDTSTTAAPESKVQDLVTLVAALNRFLIRLSALPPFQEAGLGLAEWSALSIIADRQGVNNRQLANVLGVSPQRINQITESLKAASLIFISSSADDARKKIITITPAGQARLRELNAKLQPKLSVVLSKRPGLLVRTNGLINKTLMRIVISPKPARLLEKQDLKNRNGAI